MPTTRTPSISRRTLLTAAVGSGLTMAASATATLATATPARAAQHLWTWCYQCSQLWFSGNGSGYCPVGSGIFGWDHGHQRSGSGDYVLRYDADPGVGDSHWRWCRDCAALWSKGWSDSGRTTTYCPNSSQPLRWHNWSGSGTYKIEALPDGINGPGGQRRWFLCIRCSGLFFTGNGSDGTCPAGGAHRHWKSPEPQIGYEYVLRQL
ncbi:hypothetical protein ACF08B_40585 [Streptomyces sp. NPDC015139]|uniref:hypothetical protein n=1 Tax=Streptomyces sp. NPDC015139 TaxID=3364942 RepID=UPI0036FC6801